MKKENKKVNYVKYSECVLLSQFPREVVMVTWEGQ